MGVFDFFKKKVDTRGARQAELRGDLVKATELYAQAGSPEEAARVMILRGDSETDDRRRLQLYVQAVGLAPETHAIATEARKKRATLLVAQLSAAGAGPASAAAKRELVFAAKELLEVNEPVAAAEAFRLAGDREGEAKALAASGDVERLELLLTEDQVEGRARRERKDLSSDVELYVASGRRREALVSAEKWLQTHADDGPMRERALHLKSRRALGPIAQLRLNGEKTPAVLGADVVIGRTEGTLRVASAAVSRTHVRIAREGGVIVVRDLGSRNGTQLRGMNVVGALPIGDGIDLTLGKEVRVRVSPTEAMEGAVYIEIGGERYVAPIGPGKLPGHDWELREGEAGWIELHSAEESAFLGEVSLVPATTLLVGDVISARRGGPEVLRIVGE
ncbi:hypothetical protein BH09MYX1_BH09MYX1_32080 [soil metagenome]